MEAGIECLAQMVLGFLPAWGVGHLRLCGECWDLPILPTGPCFACPSADEHLCEYVFNDADDSQDLGPVWHLDGDW